MKIVDDRWLKSLAKKFYPQVMGKKDRRIKGNIICELQPPMVSRAKDMAIESLLDKGKYSFSHMLVIKNPYGLAPLTALALFVTKKPCKAGFLVKGHQKENDISGEISGMTTRHRVPVFGLYPGEESQVVISLYDEDNHLMEEKIFSIKAPKLHPNMRNMVEVFENKEPSVFGLTFVYGGDTKYPYAFDRAGDIRYFIRRTPKAYGLHPLQEGKALFADNDILMPTYSNPHATQVLEMDLFGRIYHLYNVKYGLHHDACEITPGGNLLVAASSLEDYNEDAVWELSRTTGKIVGRLNLSPLFDDTYKDSADWAHVNTVSYDAQENTILICMRNLHSVAKIDWESKELIWLLGNPKFWKGTKQENKVLKAPEGFDEWFYQAHAAYWIEDNLTGDADTRQMIIYDNHWHKRRSVPFFNEDANSYVRIFSINEKERTVELVKSFPSLKSHIRSNGILEWEKDRIFVMSGYLNKPFDGKRGMVYEYRYSDGELLNQYGMANSYYRAYEFFADYDAMTKPLSAGEPYILGELVEPVQIEKEKLPDFAGAERMPLFRPRVPKKLKRFRDSHQERKKQWEKQVKEKGGRVINYDKELCYVHMKRREDFLYINAIDHLINQIYFVGRKAVFVQDYSWTKQTVPEYFAGAPYYVAVPLGNLPEDSYRIYLQCHEKLLRTRKVFSVETVKDH